PGRPRRRRSARAPRGPAQRRLGLRCRGRARRVARSDAVGPRPRPRAARRRQAGSGPERARHDRRRRRASAPRSRGPAGSGPAGLGETERRAEAPSDRCAAPERLPALGFGWLHVYRHALWDPLPLLAKAAARALALHGEPEDLAALLAAVDRSATPFLAAMTK